MPEDSGSGLNKAAFFAISSCARAVFESDLRPWSLGPPELFGISGTVAAARSAKAFQHHHYAKPLLITDCKINASYALLPLLSPPPPVPFEVTVAPCVGTALHLLHPGIWRLYRPASVAPGLLPSVPPCTCCTLAFGACTALHLLHPGTLLLYRPGSVAPGLLAPDDPDEIEAAEQILRGVPTKGPKDPNAQWVQVLSWKPRVSQQGLLRCCGCGG
eukprot:351645-Chlamydomonas_euryale.AAC.4